MSSWLQKEKRNQAALLFSPAYFTSSRRFLRASSSKRWTSRSFASFCSASCLLNEWSWVVFSSRGGVFFLSKVWRGGQGRRGRGCDLRHGQPCVMHDNMQQCDTNVLLIVRDCLEGSGATFLFVVVGWYVSSSGFVGVLGGGVGGGLTPMKTTLL